MSAHDNHPAPGERDAFLVDGCPRCQEYADDVGLHFDQGRFRAFWQHMIDVEYRDRAAYRSQLDKALGRRLYYVSLCLHRAFGIDAEAVASMAVVFDALPAEARELVYAEGTGPPAPAAGLATAARALLERHVALVASGDCGFWDPEAEPEVVALRAALGVGR